MVPMPYLLPQLYKMYYTNFLIPTGTQHYETLIKTPSVTLALYYKTPIKTPYPNNMVDIVVTAIVTTSQRLTSPRDTLVVSGSGNRMMTLTDSWSLAVCWTCCR